MSAPSTFKRRLPVAAAVLASPALAVLAVLLWLGRIDSAEFLICGAIVLGALALLLWHHFAHVAGVHRYLEALREPRRAEDLTLARPRRSPILAPLLEEAVVETAQERQRRRRELEAVVAGNESILSNLPDPLIMLDRRRRILRANPAAAALLGEELSGRDLVTVLRNPELLKAADAALSGQPAGLVEFNLAGPVERHLEAQIVPLSTPALDGTVAILALHDLTSIYRIEQMRADFVANASHELRTPLSSLVGFLETLAGPAKDDPAARERFIAIMQEQAQRMARLIDDLLSLSRIEMLEHTPPSGSSELRGLVGSVAEGLQMKAAAKDMTIELEGLEEAWVLGGRDELAQIFQNLIENAVKYGRAGSEVEVRLSRVSPEEDAAARRLGRDCIGVAVSDRGEGIAREHLPRLTERFYRVDTARSRALGGTGLGLAIVKHLVNRHRGHLSIDSTLGEGSVFKVTLPLAEPPQTAAVEPKEGEEETSPLRRAGE